MKDNVTDNLTSQTMTEKNLGHNELRHLQKKQHQSKYKYCSQHSFNFSEKGKSKLNNRVKWQFVSNFQCMPLNYMYESGQKKTQHQSKYKYCSQHSFNFSEKGKFK